MRSEAEIRAMLKTVEAMVTDDTESSDAETIIGETLVWVLHNEVDDDRITDYLPE